MKKSTEIYNELLHISKLLAEAAAGNAYVVPNGYFETLQWRVMGSIHTETYKVPAEYFSQLTDKVMQRINAENALEKDELPEILQKAPRGNVYTVPENYFNETKQINETKVIPLPRATGKRTWWRVAAAACAVGIIASGIYFAVSGSKTSHTADSQQVVIEGTGGLTYQQIQEINIDKELDKISEKEVDKYLCDEGLIVCADKPAEESIEKAIDNADISEDDLNKALDEL